MAPGGVLGVNRGMSARTPSIDDVHVIGIAWYRLEDYPAIKSVMADGHTLPGTYSEWRARAEQVEKQRRRHGQQVVRVYLDPIEFPRWCQARGLNVDADGRREFANVGAKDAYQKLQGTGKAGGSA